MELSQEYVFKSERLGFRNWIDSDIDKMIAISGDQRVMEFFPATATPIQTKTFIQRMQELFEREGFCYFAVDSLEDGKLIGFIGLNEVNYEADFSPAIDIGWRLGVDYWNKGYATEGAKRCLEFAFETLKLKEVIATAPAINLKSIAVMKKIGMQLKTPFKHPRLIGDSRLENCVCYAIR